MAHFDDAAATWDDPAKLERAQRASALLRERLPLRTTDRVLDVGAGTGQLTFNLIDAIGSATISDSSAGMIEQAQLKIEQGKLTERVEARQLDLTDSADQLEAESYDGAWSMLALHHVDDIELLLRRVRDVLRPGGWVAVIDLDADDDGAFHEHNPDFDGHHGFSRDAFAQSLQNAGFTDIEISDGGIVDKEVHEQIRPFPLFLAIARK
ncbi:methyltransferase domain-containing protein [Epidermidibacterium keratini]|uniref:Methyltransferase domain-containing protein n=1 Tax=Epidermidibacterium keratini TaxID=1891644 RepID=A0A7L4YN39_9ACTN|nr:class I SAM-dependent methyltransferase [Epidermidibacterium keratini]QHC00556.1 methyltransferase domain-containing protein [Epidermidibacterium keratini]